MPRSKAQLGCLTALLLFALLGLGVEYFGKPGPPEDDEGGERIAVFVILGLIMYFVIFTIPAIVYGILARRRRYRVGRCANCGYDLRATPQRCPECGLAVEWASKA